MVASPVPDIRDVQNAQFPKYSVTLDWQLMPDGTLDDRQALATAVAVALGTNGLANPDDILPDPDSTDRCGWWGDMDAGAIWNGWPIGSKIWLMRRAKINPVEALEGGPMVRIRDYIFEAINPLIQRKIASSFQVWLTRVDKQRIDALIRIYRGPRQAVDLLYQILWDEMVETQGINNPRWNF
jgi:phage gp46-like protein